MRSGKIPQSAQKKFTDREEWLETFNRLISEQNVPRPDGLGRNRIVCWHGDGGQGKSSLCFQLMKEVRRRQSEGGKFGLALLDFDDPKCSDVEAATLRLRQHLGLTRDIRFPTFDAAFAELFRRQSPEGNIREKHPYLFRTNRNELVQDLLDLGNNLSPMIGIPGIPSIEILFKWGYRLTGHSLDWWTRSRTKELVREMEELSDSNLRERLPHYLGRDAVQAMKDDDTLQIVLMLDTFEMVSSRHSSRTRQWAKTLLTSTPGALVAIFGRDRATWPEDEELTSSIEYHLLEGLSDGDADSFLAGAGVEDKGIRARIVEGANGVPFYLDLSVDEYWRIIENGRTPDPQDFGRTKAEVLERFLSHLGERERDEIQLASFPVILTEQLFGDMASRFSASMMPVDWSGISERSFIEAGEDGTARMHRVMKSVLQDLSRRGNPSKYVQIHAWLFDRFSTIALSSSAPREISVTNDAALVAAVHHRAQYEPQELCAWFNSKALMPFFEAERWSALSEAITLIEAALHERGDISSDALARLHFSSGHIFQRTGELAKAADRYRKALMQQRLASGKEEAYAKQALAEVLLQLGIEIEAAEALLQEARDLYERETESRHAGLANCLVGLASVAVINKRPDDVIELLEHAQKIYRSHVDANDMEYIRFLVKLHVVYLECGRADQAELRLEEARQTLEEADRTDTALYATVLSYLEGCPGRLAKVGASERLSTLVETCERLCGRDHPVFGWALFLQAKFADDGQRNAPIDQLKRSLDILGQALGPNQRSTLAVQDYLQSLQTS